MGDQGPDNADMGKSPRGPAAERQPDHRPPDAAEPHLVTVVGAVLAAPDQIIQHLSLLERKIFADGRAPPELTTSMVYAAVRAGLGRDMLDRGSRNNIRAFGVAVPWGRRPVARGLNLPRFR